MPSSKKPDQTKTNTTAALGTIAAGGLTAKATGASGLARAVGAKRVFHGTSNEAAKAILRDGLRASYGASAGGSSQAAGDARFLTESKNRIHVASGFGSRLAVANRHAGLSAAQAAAVKAGRNLSESEVQKAYLMGSGGRTLEAALPFEEFKRTFEQDPDHIPGLAFRGERDLAAKNFKQSRGYGHILRARSKDLGAYIKNHPGRFASGVALLAAPAAAGYGTYRVLKRKSQSSKDKTAGVRLAAFSDELSAILMG